MCWESLRRRNNAKNAIRNNAESAINMRAIKNNAENAIKQQRTIMRQRQQAPASVFCKDQAARQSARDACLARGSFVDRAGRSMIEYRYNSSERHMEVFSILEG